MIKAKINNNNNNLNGYVATNGHYLNEDDVKVKCEANNFDIATENGSLIINQIGGESNTNQSGYSQINQSHVRPSKGFSFCFFKDKIKIFSLIIRLKSIIKHFTTCNRKYWWKWRRWW